MRKFISLLLALTLIVCCCMTAFAETGGSQTITLEVPEPTEIIPCFVIKKPVVGEQFDYSATVDENALNHDKYYARLSSAYVDDTQISPVEAYTCAAGTYKYILSAWLNSDTYGYIISNDVQATVLVDTGKLNGDGSVIYETYNARRTNVNGVEPYAEFEFTLDVAPSWTLTIPSTQSIEFGVECSPLNLSTSVSGVENLSDSVPVYVFAKYDGSFKETSDSSKTISYAIENGNRPYMVNTLFKVNTNVKNSEEDTRSDHQEAENAVLRIWKDSWNHAMPGSYEAAVTYTSSIEDLIGQGD